MDFFKSPNIINEKTGFQRKVKQYAQGPSASKYRIMSNPSRCILHLSEKKKGMQILTIFQYFVFLPTWGCYYYISNFIFPPFALGCKRIHTQTGPSLLSNFFDISMTGKDSLKLPRSLWTAEPITYTEY